jgi:hypothetical protein
VTAITQLASFIMTKTRRNYMKRTGRSAFPRG